MYAVVLAISMMVSGGDRQVYYFTAEWCGPCRQIKPMISRLQKTHPNLKVFNIDRQGEMFRRYGGTAIPYFVVVEDKKIVDRHTGGLSEANLLRMLRGNPSPYILRPPTRALPSPESNLARASVRIVIETTKTKTPNGYITSIAVASGTCIEWSNGTGLVASANHNFASGETPMIEFRDGKKYRGKVVCRGSQTDLALVEFHSKEPRPFVPVAREPAKAGDRVVTYGYPGSRFAKIETTVLTTDRFYEPLPQGNMYYIELNSPLRVGHSGGGLFLNGELVGVASASDAKALFVPASQVWLAIEFLRSYRKKNAA